MSDRQVPVAWPDADRVVMRDLFGGAQVPRDQNTPGSAYVWREGRGHGRGDVTLKRVGDDWSVTCTTAGRLLGPRNVLHLARYGRADLAVWDVMARVTKFTHDEEEALKAGSEAAQWIRSTGIVDGDDEQVVH